MPVKYCHALTFLQGRPRQLGGRWPCTTGLASYLSSCLSFTAGRCRFPHRPSWERFTNGKLTSPPSPSAHPARELLPFRIPLATRNLRANAPVTENTRRKHPRTLARSNNCRSVPDHCVHPSGRNLTGKTSLDSQPASRMAARRLTPIRTAGQLRPCPGEPVKNASRQPPKRQDPKGPGAPAYPDLSPGFHPGLSRSELKFPEARPILSKNCDKGKKPLPAGQQKNLLNCWL